MSPHMNSSLPLSSSSAARYITQELNRLKEHAASVLVTSSPTTLSPPMSATTTTATFESIQSELDLNGKDYTDFSSNFVITGESPDPFPTSGESYNVFFSSFIPSSSPSSVSHISTTENYFGTGGNYNLGIQDDFWTSLDAKNLRHNLGWTIALIIAYLVILVIGIIGNCMVILVVLLRPQMRTVTNMFIMNLAVADLFVIVFCVPATLLANVLMPWILGSFMCKGVAYVQGVSVCASAYSLAAISLDRCKAIYRPMERPRGLSKRQALATICLIWILALLMTLPWAVVFDVVKSEKDGLLYCLETWRNEEHGKVYFLVANLICCYSLPLVLISLSNVVIWCHVSRRKVPEDSASIGTIKRMHRRTRHGVRKMLGIVTLAFLISWLPLYVLVTRMKFSSQGSIGETEANLLSILIPFAQWLGSWNSSINPVLYAFLNSKFRESFRSLLPSWMPLASRGNGLMNGVATNGTIVGTTGTPSYTTVYTARGSSRSMRSAGSSIGSRRYRRSHRDNLHNQHQLQPGSAVLNQRTLIISQIKPSNNIASCSAATGAATITDL